MDGSIWRQDSGMPFFTQWERKSENANFILVISGKSVCTHKKNWSGKKTSAFESRNYTKVPPPLKEFLLFGKKVFFFFTNFFIEKKLCKNRLFSACSTFFFRGIDAEEGEAGGLLKEGGGEISASPSFFLSFGWVGEGGED